MCVSNISLILDFLQPTKAGVYMHKIILQGNLGRDPSEKFTSNGSKLITFPIAVSVKKDEIVWYECNIWDKKIFLFENILPHLKKGSKIAVVGDLAVPEIYKRRRYQNKVKIGASVHQFSFHFKV
jgi:single-stranded DNA-binding protein